MSEALRLIPGAVLWTGCKVSIWGWEDAWELVAGVGRCLVPQGSWGSIKFHLFRPHPQAHERLEETKLEAVRDNNLELVQEILRDLAQLAEQSSTAAELARILQEPHFQVWSSPGLLGWRRQEVRTGMGRDLGDLPHGPSSSPYLPSPSWRRTTLWPQRPMRHHPPALAWTPRSATSPCLLMRCAWWASARRLESIW